MEKLKYIIATVVEKTVCVPSNDYYARGDDWSRNEITHIEEFQKTFDTIEEGIEYINENLPKGRYLFLPVYDSE